MSAEWRELAALVGDFVAVRNVGLSQENVTLIKEINDLRRELSEARTHAHDLEAALGIHRKNKAHARAAADALDCATTTNKNAVMQLQLDEKCKVVELQKAEIMRLRSQLVDMERAASAASRPTSAPRLPPMSVGAQ